MSLTATLVAYSPSRSTAQSRLTPARQAFPADSASSQMVASSSPPCSIARSCAASMTVPSSSTPILACSRAVLSTTMLVDHEDRAWVGNFGFDLFGGAPACSTALICVASDGTATVAAHNRLRACLSNQRERGTFYDTSLRHRRRSLRLRCRDCPCRACSRCSSREADRQRARTHPQTKALLRRSDRQGRKGRRFQEGQRLPAVATLSYQNACPCAEHGQASRR